MNLLKNNEILRTESNTSVILRDYQQTALDQILTKWDDGIRSLLFQMPTGTGKTVLFSEISRLMSNNDKKALIVVHRRELVEQAVSKLSDIGITAGIIMAGEIPDNSRKVQIASIRTLNNLEKPITDFVIIDEAHHATATTYRKLWNFYPEAKFLGVTATPIRLNGEGFDDLFDELIVSDSIQKFINNGYLVPIKHIIGSKPKLSNIQIRCGDYHKVTLSEKMREAKILCELIKCYRENCYKKSTIVFAVDIDHSKLISELYNAHGIKAAHIDASTPKLERKQILNDFRNKTIKVVCNAEIITEGFDFPACEVVQLARPTKSLSLYLQMVGRVMRPSEGKKVGIVLDHANLELEHGSAIADRKWSLVGLGIKTTEKKTYKLENKEAIIKRYHANLKEIRKLKLVPHAIYYKNLRAFEKILLRSIRINYALSNSYKIYINYLKIKNTELSKTELEYIKIRLNSLNDLVPEDQRIPEGFWEYESNKKTSRQTRISDSNKNGFFKRQIQYSR